MNEMEIYFARQNNLWNIGQIIGLIFLAIMLIPAFIMSYCYIKEWLIDKLRSKYGRRYKNIRKNNSNKI